MMERPEIKPVWSVVPKRDKVTEAKSEILGVDLEATIL
jgi:hypothetical protein